MYTDIPIILAIVFVVVGLFTLAWSADTFIDGAASIAKALGINPFVVGMVVIGFGTSAPELCVSALSGFSGHSDLSLGNAYGSDVFNIAAILGVAALIRPIAVKPSIVYAAVPTLIAITLLSCLLVITGSGFSRMDGVIMLVTFAVLLPMYCWFDGKDKPAEVTPHDANKSESPSIPVAVAKLVGGLLLLVGSSHILVWGAVDLARALGVSELMIGLTIVGIGTSLPELASAIAAARRGQNEFVLGNIVGSNFFNTLAVVGLAGTISPFNDISKWVLWRDLPIILILSATIALFGFNWRDRRLPGRINRIEGAIWTLFYLAYLGATILIETRTT